MPDRLTSFIEFCGRVIDAAQIMGSMFFLCALRIAEGLAQCWYIIAVVLFSAIILVDTEQGREAILAAAESPDLAALAVPNQEASLQSALSSSSFFLRPLLLVSFCCQAAPARTGRHATLHIIRRRSSGSPLGSCLRSCSSCKET